MTCVVSLKSLSKYYRNIQEMMLKLKINYEDCDPWTLQMIDGYQTVLYAILQKLKENGECLNL